MTKETNKPLVSVIIPVYNVAPFLREALDSVIGQTYKNLEIIIIDDGSTDGSSQICDEYSSDSRIRVIHQEHRGVSIARNVGLDRMTGEYVGFLDSDDAFHLDFITVMVETIEREKTDIVVCQYTSHHTLGKMNPLEDNELAPLLKQGRHNRVDSLRAPVDGRLNYAVWNKLYRANLWKGIRFTERHVYEDVDTTLRILDSCESIFMLIRPLYMHRRHPGSITQTQTMDNVRDYMIACISLESFVSAHTPDVFSLRQLTKIRHDRTKSMMTQYAKTREDKEFSEELRREILLLGEKLEQEAGMEGIRTRVAFSMFRFCPRIFRACYMVYCPVSLLARRRGFAKCEGYPIRLDKDAGRAVKANTE